MSTQPGGGVSTLKRRCEADGAKVGLSSDGEVACVDVYHVLRYST